MINLKNLVPAIIFAVWFSGCTQSLHKPGISRDYQHIQPEPSEMSQKVNELSSVELYPAQKITTPNEETQKDEEIATLDYENNTRNPETPIADKTAQSVIDQALDFCQLAQDYWQKGELENALEALDQAYALILNIDTYDIPKLIQQKEDLRFLISKRILEIYASRNIVVNGGHNEIPVVLNSYVQAELDLFTKGVERNFFMRAYQRSGRYRGQIVAALKEAGLPVELSWLPLIESGFNVKALSRSRALGLWQFIPSTGYKFGLKRDLHIDERMDPEKSTAAAIEYLKELHHIFGDWSTVLAAYNCGEGKVLRIIRDQNLNYLDNFWDFYERLPRETARYVPRFLATIHIMNNLETYGFDSIALDQPVEYEIISVNKQIRLADTAERIGISEKSLAELNPELRYSILPPEKYELKVPPGKAEILLASLEKIPVSMPPRPDFVQHRVKQGETLAAIAKRYRTNVRSIVVANNLHNANYVVAGTKLRIPQKGSTIYSKISPKTAGAERTTTYVVKSGDSLYNLAKRYNTTTKLIQQLNNLAGTNLYIGQVLKLPGGQAENASKGSLKPYIVQKGDSLYKIASLHNIPLERFLKMNHLAKESTIYPGQTLFVE